MTGNVVWTALRVLAAAVDGALGAIKAPVVDDVHRYADILAEAEAETEVFEPLAQCTSARPSGVDVAGGFPAGSTPGPAGNHQPLAELLTEAADCVDVLLTVLDMIAAFSGHPPPPEDPEYASLPDRLRAAAAQVNDTN